VTKREILGVQIWECSPAEAKAIWTEQPNERWRIWSTEEVDKYMLAGPSEIQSVIDKKRAKPGR
jgi:hypothetical protein